MLTKEHRESLLNIYSDVYKEAYGHRALPNENWTDAELLQRFEDLSVIAERHAEEERKAQENAAKLFEERVARVIELGAGDRENALRWIMDAEDVHGDWEFLAWKMGLKHNYFAKEAQEEKWMVLKTIREGNKE